MRARSLFALAIPGLLAACASSASTGSSSESTVAPAGVFTRDDGDMTIHLAFVNGKGARFTVTPDEKGDVTERTCFTYDGATGKPLKATLKTQIVARNGVSTEADVAGRIVERPVTMAADGSKIDSDGFLESGRFEYKRDSKSASEVLGDCK